MIENDNCIVPQMALDIKFEELKQENNTIKKYNTEKDKQIAKVEDENAALKRKIDHLEEDRDVERMSMKALERFIAAEINKHQETINDMNTRLEDSRHYYDQLKKEQERMTSQHKEQEDIKATYE